MIYFAALEIPPLRKWQKSEKMNGKRSYIFYLPRDAAFGIHPGWKRVGRRNVFSGYSLVIWEGVVGGSEKRILGEYKRASDAVEIARGVWEQELESRFF